MKVLLPLKNVLIACVCGRWRRQKLESQGLLLRKQCRGIFASISTSGAWYDTVIWTSHCGLFWNSNDLLLWLMLFNLQRIPSMVHTVVLGIQYLVQWTNDYSALLYDVWSYDTTVWQYDICNIHKCILPTFAVRTVLVLQYGVKRTRYLVVSSKYDTIPVLPVVPVSAVSCEVWGPESGVRSPEYEYEYDVLESSFLVCQVQVGLVACLWSWILHTSIPAYQHTEHTAYGIVQVTSTCVPTVWHLPVELLYSHSRCILSTVLICIPVLPIVSYLQEDSTVWCAQRTNGAKCTVHTVQRANKSSPLSLSIAIHSLTDHLTVNSTSRNQWSASPLTGKERCYYL